VKPVRKVARKPPPPRRARRELTFEAFARLDRNAVLFLIYLYCLIHWTVRVAVSPVFTMEEAGELLMSQSLQFGYDAREPPLLAWLHAIVMQAPAPVTAPLVLGVKYVLLAAGLSLYYLAARNILTRPGVSAAAVAAWGLTYTVGWNMHEDLVGGAGLMAAMALSLHAVTRILAWRRVRDWAYLGVAMGLGLLTHHLYLTFPLALLGAAMLSPFFREAVRPGLLVLAGGIALVMYAPYAIWLAANSESIAFAVRDFAETWEMDPAWFARVQDGAVNLGRALLSASLPLSIFWATLFWPLWLPIIYPVFSRRSTDEEPHEEALRRLLIAAAVLATFPYLLSVLFGVAQYRNYWLLPVLFTLPIWMFAHVKRAGDFPIAMRGFAALFIFATTAVVAGRFVEWQMDIRTCDEDGCDAYMPVQPWAEALRQAGFEGGTIVGADRHLTGNLRAAFPEARVMDASLAPAAFPPPQIRGACLAVWRNDIVMPSDLMEYLTQQLGAIPRDEGPEGAIRRNLRMSDTKGATLYFNFVPPSEACR
jgi:hypothetical protein